MKKIVAKIKKYGIFGSLVRVVGGYFYSIIRQCYKFWLSRFSKIDEQQILFFSTPSFSDNGKVMYEFLLNSQEEKEFKFVWLIHREDDIPNRNIPNTRFIRCDSYYYKGFSLRALHDVATSKYIFFTHASPMKHIEKRRGQIVVNLWHGCGYKDIQDGKSPWIQQNPFDAAIVPGTKFIETKSKFWGCEKEKILAVGYPRYDLFRKEDLQARKYIEGLKGASEQLIIWMPTFRKTRENSYPEERIEYGFELPILTSDADVMELNEYCRQKKITLCLKRHPKQIEYSCEKNQYSNICFISHVDLLNADIDLYAMLQYTDALISDYSSIAIDYLLLNKPIAFALDDFEKYQAARGFVFSDPLNYMPGHHIYCLEDLYAFLDDVSNGIDRFAEDRERIMPEVHNPCDNYCQRILEELHI